MDGFVKLMELCAFHHKLTEHRLQNYVNNKKKQKKKSRSYSVLLQDGQAGSNKCCDLGKGY